MGSPTIRDFPTDPIEVECKKCGRNGRYRKATLIEKYGRDTVLPDLLALLASDCEERTSLGNRRYIQKRNCDMQWTEEQFKEFDRNGVLFVERLFNETEIAALNSELPNILRREGPVNLKEQTSDSIRSAIAPHHSSDLYRRLSLHPRIIEPAIQYLGGPVYLHQFKVNTKNAHDGEIWHWHQDYRTWFEDDGMPKPNVINAALFLDEVTEFNGPIMFVVGSHKLGMVLSDKTFQRIPEYGRLAEDAIGSPYANETIDRLINKYGLIAPKGPAGSVVFFHGCTLHGSVPNMSPWNRTVVFWSPNRTNNAITAPTRPEFLALQDFSAVEPLADDCLVN